MNVRGRSFEVDRRDGKLLGVCAGLANATGVDAVIFRIGFVLGTLLLGTFHGFPWAFAVYGALALAGSGVRRRDRTAIVPADHASERERARELRMRAIETYAASSNSALAREIDSLR
jgi:phage shock protein C